MSARARVDSMRPKQPGSTRTAPPSMPDLYWTRGRYLPYIAFGSCGLLLLLVGFGILRSVWVLGSHDPAAWSAHLAAYRHPLYLLFHLVALLAITWFGLRFFGLFPKTQPSRIGPLKPPPEPVLLFLLRAAFAVATLLVVAVLGGALG
jgi:fumarate reductase subunit C